MGVKSLRNAGLEVLTTAGLEIKVDMVTHCH